MARSMVAALAWLSTVTLAAIMTYRCRRPAARYRRERSRGPPPAKEQLHGWMFVTRWWRRNDGEPGGSGGINDALLRLHDPGIGQRSWVPGSSARPDGRRTRSG